MIGWFVTKGQVWLTWSYTMYVTYVVWVMIILYDMCDIHCVTSTQRLSYFTWVTSPMIGHEIYILTLTQNMIHSWPFNEGSFDAKSMQQSKSHTSFHKMWTAMLLHLHVKRTNSFSVWNSRTLTELSYLTSWVWEHVGWERLSVLLTFLVCIRPQQRD